MSSIVTLGPVGFNPTGAYDPTKQYEKLDVVYYQGSSYVATDDSIGQLPTNSDYWDCIALGTLKQFTYNSVAEMKLDNSLEDGMFVETAGYYAANDGGGATYKIRTKTNADTPDEGFLIAIGTILVAELVYNTNINILCLGAKGDGTFDNKNIIDNAIAHLTNGGTLYFPEGTYLTSGNHIIDINGKLTIKGAGEFATTISYNGNNICFWCKNENDHLFVPVEFRDFRIHGSNSTDPTIAFRLSDRWGYTLKNIFSYGFNSGTFCQFYNDLYWTEGAIIENCMIRDALNGFSCKRSIDSEYNSFFNIKIDNVSMRVSGTSNFINLKETESEDYPIMAYSWIINANGVWPSNNALFINVGNYNYISGKITLVQDGGYAPIQVYDNGMCDVEGEILYRTNIKVVNLTRKIFTSLKQYTKWQRTADRRPLARFKGLRIFGGSTILSADTNQVVYNSDFLPPFTNYKLTIKGHVQGTDQEFNNEYIISLLDANHNPLIKVLNSSSNYNDALIYPRPLNNGNPGETQNNSGLQFDIFCKTNVANIDFSFELEML